MTSCCRLSRKTLALKQMLLTADHLQQLYYMYQLRGKYTLYTTMLQQCRTHHSSHYTLPCYSSAGHIIPHTIHCHATAAQDTSFLTLYTTMLQQCRTHHSSHYTLPCYSSAGHNSYIRHVGLQSHNDVRAIAITPRNGHMTKQHIIYTSSPHIL